MEDINAEMQRSNSHMRIRWKKMGDTIQRKFGKMRDKTNSLDTILPLLKDLAKKKRQLLENTMQEILTMLVLDFSLKPIGTK